MSSLVRYLAVSRPITINRAKQNWGRVLKLMAPVLIFAVLFNLPVYFEFFTVRGQCIPSNETQTNIGK